MPTSPLNPPGWPCEAGKGSLGPPPSQGTWGYIWGHLGLSQQGGLLLTVPRVEARDAAQFPQHRIIWSQMSIAPRSLLQGKPCYAACFTAAETEAQREITSCPGGHVPHSCSSPEEPPASPVGFCPQETPGSRPGLSESLLA